MDSLVVERADGVVTCTLNRPAKKNALTGEMWRGLTALFDEVAENRDDRVLVITGAGDGFCSGADLGNSAGDSGGLALAVTTGLVRSTIIAGNVDTAGGETPDCAGTIQSGDYNLIGNDSGCAFIGPTAHTLRNVPAMLGPLQNNGGPTWTIALGLGSAAIDAGETVIRHSDFFRISGLAHLL